MFKIDPGTIDRQDVLDFLHRHLALLHGKRQADQDGDDCVVIKE